MLVNTQEFRREALYWEKYKKYDCGVRGSQSYKRWWDEQHKRCIEGYSVGGVKISGYYYNYLNFCPIMKTTETYGTVHKSKAKHADRVEGFPDFWDVDFIFFTSLDIAEYGISLEDYKKLPISLDLVETEENLSGGKHMGWLKTRGVGASFKGGSIPARNYFHLPRSKSYLFAHEKEYLTKDGIFSKFLNYKSFINTHTEFRKRADFKDSETEMHCRASYKDDTGVERGYKSEVIGITFNNSGTDKARGKRGKAILYEEFGKFPNGDEVWEIARDSVTEGEITFGTQIMFGTGGSDDTDFQAMSKMAERPEAYGLLEFKNIYEPGLEDTKFIMFTPVTMNVRHKDEHGNSDKVTGEKIADEKRESAGKSKDPRTLIRRKAENPKTPTEAMSGGHSNKFNVLGLAEWRNKVASTPNLREYGVPKELYIKDGKVEAKLSHKKPINLWPHTSKDDIDGCIVEYEIPYKVNGSIPDNLYYICHDPYADSDAEDTTSLGSAYVLMNINNIVPYNKGDKIVASYNGRPLKTDTYNENLFLLARRWNAKICFENDRGGAVIDYAKRFKLLHWLVPELELSWEEKIATRNPKIGKYGMRIGSGRDNLRKLTGDKYFIDWLIQPRSTTETGETILNYHTIYDLGLLDECRLSKPNSNLDRISALRVGMFYARELIYKNVVATNRKNVTSINRFFKKELYAA